MHRPVHGGSRLSVQAGSTISPSAIQQSSRSRPPMRSNGLLGEPARDAHADTRFEVGRRRVALRERRRQRAVGEHHLVAPPIETGRVGHPRSLTEQVPGPEHPHRGREITFAAGHDAVVVQFGEGETSRRARIVEEIETAHGDRGEAATLHHVVEGAGHARSGVDASAIDGAWERPAERSARSTNRSPVMPAVRRSFR